MYFIPLNQAESVELIIHALRVAGGQAVCSTCPTRKSCMKQCVALADGIERMWQAGVIPSDDQEERPRPPDPEPPKPSGGPKLTVVK